MRRDLVALRRDLVGMRRDLVGMRRDLEARCVCGLACVLTMPLPWKSWSRKSCCSSWRAGLRHSSHACMITCQIREVAAEQA